MDELTDSERDERLRKLLAAEANCTITPQGQERLNKIRQLIDDIEIRVAQTGSSINALSEVASAIEEVARALGSVALAIRAAPGPESSVEDLAKRHLKKCIDADPKVAQARANLAAEEKDLQDAAGRELATGNSEASAAASLGQAKTALASGTGTKAAVDAAQKAYDDAAMAHTVAIFQLSTAREEVARLQKTLDEATKEAREKCLKQMRGD